MASTVLSGSGNLSYTNNTGGTVRVIIYSICFSTPSPLSISWGNSQNPTGTSLSNVTSMGKNLAMTDTSLSFSGQSSLYNFTTMTFTTVSDNLAINYLFEQFPITTTRYYSYSSAPTEIFINNNEIFSISSTANISGYNILVVPENG